MPQNNTGFRKSLDGLIEARNRESRRQVSFHMQHQLIGAFTKRP